jgi:hypothetical protein
MKHMQAVKVADAIPGNYDISLYFRTSGITGLEIIDGCLGIERDAFG